MKLPQVKEIKNQLSKLFSDTSVSPNVTRSALQELRDEIDSMLDTLPEEKR